MRRRPLSDSGMLTGLLVWGFFAMAAVALARDPFHLLPPDQQRSAPAFILPDYEGNPLASAALHGKVVVVRFWATW